MAFQQPKKSAKRLQRGPQEDDPCRDDDADLFQKRQAVEGQRPAEPRMIGEEDMQNDHMDDSEEGPLWRFIVQVCQWRHEMSPER
jgi:hypothetical protein